MFKPNNFRKFTFEVQGDEHTARFAAIDIVQFFEGPQHLASGFDDAFGLVHLVQALTVVFVQTGVKGLVGGIVQELGHPIAISKALVLSPTDFNRILGIEYIDNISCADFVPGCRCVKRTLSRFYSSFTGVNTRHIRHYGHVQ